MAGGDGVLRAKLRVPRVKALPRERLYELLAAVWEHRLALVVAPAGSGKTTLLAQFAATDGIPVAWYRAEPADASAAAAVAHLERGLVSAFGLEGGWTDIDDAIDALDTWSGQRGLIVVDDLHSLWGTEAEATLERLLAHLPPGVVMVAATRRAPGFNLSRLRVSGELLELGPEELRFRSWEVERLFLDFYGEPLRPDELADLARRTEGWAAGLQLFHLATRGKPASDRRRVLHELGARSRLVREYLARNVLDELPLHVRDFLLQTCVLGRLSASLCDELTGGTSGDALLAELEQRQIFTTPLDDEEGSYRYHEVLRSHLEAVLLEQLGEAAARARYRHAASLLETRGYLQEALRAYCRAEDWEAATRLLGGWGERVIDRPGAWIDALPPALLEHDPWLLLASARRLLVGGEWDAATDAYRRAESSSGPGEPGESSRRERVALEGWFHPPVSSPADWLGILRLAVAKDPTGVVRREAGRLRGPEGALVDGLALLLAGQVRDAARRLDAVADRADASIVVSLGASVAAVAARLLAGESPGSQLTGLFEAADAAGLPWLASLTRVVAGIAEGGDVEALTSLVAKDDVWGLPLAQLCAGLGLLRSAPARAPVVLRESADGFAAVGAGTLEAWARSGAAYALAVTGHRDALGVARAATAATRAAGVIAPQALISGAAALVDPEAVHHHRSAARAVMAETGFALAPLDDVPAGDERMPPPHASVGRRLDDPPFVVRCLGPLQVDVGDGPIDLGAIKPRVRTLLRILAMHAGRPVHRDKLVEWLWPGEADPRVGTRNLQVAISSLRQLLEPGVARGAATILVRDGDTYRLDVPGDRVDIGRFETLVAAARAARVAGEAERAVDAFGAALDLYAGELLAEEGAAEWVLPERDRLRTAAVDAAQGRAELLLAAGDAAAAATEADRGLRLDQYRDELWRVSIAANEAAGQRAAAGRVRERYDAVLRELGVTPSS
jgi:DNA-binding SARP family transcriptional activator